MAKYVKYKVATGTNMVDHRYNTGRWAPGETKLVIEDDVAAAMVANLPDVFELAADQIAVGSSLPDGIILTADGGIIANGGTVPPPQPAAINISLGNKGAWTDATYDAWASVSLGDSNVAQGESGVQLGYYNQNLGDYYSVLLGSSNTVNGGGSEGNFVAGIGNDVEAGWSYCAVVGNNNTAAHAGGLTYGQKATNRLSHALCGSPNAPQVNTYRAALSRQLVNATPAFLQNGVGGSGLAVPADCTWAFDILVVVRSNEAQSNVSAGYRFTGGVQNDEAGNCSFPAAPTKEVLWETDAAFDCAVVADDTADELRIQATSLAGGACLWGADIRIIQVNQP